MLWICDVCGSWGNFCFVVFLDKLGWTVLEEIVMHALAYLYWGCKTGVAEHGKRNQSECTGKCNSSNPGLEHCKTQMVNQR